MSESQSPDSPAPETDPLVGIELGNYHIVELIGEGGMGAVYAARHPVLGREVAVKVLSRKFCDEEDFLARFRQEALAANRVGHEVIVEAIDFGELPDGRSYYVMERLQGESLGAMMDRRGAIPLVETAEIMLPVMDALQAAHDAGVIHRDLKPDNIFLHRGRRQEVLPRLLDFGLAKMLEMDQTGTGVTTQTGLLLGTPLYMPPEQFSGKPETLGPWTDVYALAGVIFHMLAARPPYDERGFADLLMQHMQAPIPSICDRKAGLPPSLDHMLQLALAKKPDERFQNMRALRQAFEAAVKGAADLGVGATIRPVPEVDLFPRKRAAPKDAITVAARKTPSQSELPAAPKAPEAPAASTEAPATPRMAVSMALRPESSASPKPALEAKPAPEAEPKLAALSFDDHRPGSEPNLVIAAPGETPITATPTPKPKSEPRPVVEPTPPTRSPALDEDAPETGGGGRGLGTALLILLLLGGAGAGGYAYWRSRQTTEAPKRGTLMVDAQPKGALIRIDNEATWAPTPVKRELAVGSHRVTIKKIGFDQIVTWVSIRPGKRTNLALDLLPSSRSAPGNTMQPDAPHSNAPAGSMTPPDAPRQPPGMASNSGTMRPAPPPMRWPGHDRGTHTAPPRRRVTTQPMTTMAGGTMSIGISALLTQPPNIGAAIQRLYPRLKSCFLKANPGSDVLKKHMRVALRIGSNGRVTSARVRPGPLAATAVGRCIRNKAKAWKLPPYPNPYIYSFSVQFSR